MVNVLQRSGVGARLEVDTVPRSAVMATQPLALQRECTLAGGDDYELLFCAPAANEAAVHAAAARAQVRVTRVGRIEATAGLRLVDAEGRSVAQTFTSFDHFRT